jgi:gas vesicle structural protein
MSMSPAPVEARAPVEVREEAREVTLLDLVDRAIEHGAILAGDITIAVANIDLIYVGLEVLIASIERMETLRAERERTMGREVYDG